MRNTERNKDAIRYLLKEPRSACALHINGQHICLEFLLDLTEGRSKAVFIYGPNCDVIVSGSQGKRTVVFMKNLKTDEYGGAVLLLSSESQATDILGSSAVPTCQNDHLSLAC